MVTPLQQRVFDYIDEFIQDYQYSPSLTEVASGIGISPNSISLISRSIHALVNAGRLEFHKKGYRNIQVVRQVKESLPMLGDLTPGETFLADPVPNLLNLQKLLKEDGLFSLNVAGDGLYEAGVRKGDILMLKPARFASEGDTVLATIDHKDAVLAKLSFHIADRVTLIPVNSTLKPKAYLTHRVHLQGVFVALLRWPDGHGNSEAISI